MATHNAGHTLDLVISDDVCGELDSLELHDPGLSDHQCISFNIALSSVGSTRDRVHIRRNWSTFDRAAFESDLAASELALSSSTDVEWLYGEYDNCISKLLDKHAPARTRVIKDRPLAPWFDLECVLEKRGVRRLESTLRRTESPICYREWRAGMQRYRELLFKKQQLFWSSRVSAAAGDSRQLWKSLRPLFTPPSSPQPEFLADTFAEYFRDKVELIRGSSEGAPIPYVMVPMTERLTSFKPVTSDDVSQMLKRCPTKQCSLDPLPTWLIKEAAESMSPILAKMINASLLSSEFPVEHKHAVVTPIVKKPGLDAAQLASYRPISNLSFVSKLLERTVAGQVRTYLDKNDLFPPLQSAYRPKHSTETALLKVFDNAYMAADDGMVTLLVLLDFSAAFDTVDHDIALSILRDQFGFAGEVEEWFRNYLQDRSFAVKVGMITSSTIRLNCSFPQGSTLGPLLYVLYAAELRLVSERHGVSFHGFADDSQLSKSMRVGEIQAAKQAMIDCVMAIKHWSHSHRLKLNASKSEVIWIDTSQQLAHLTEDDKQLVLPDGTTITASTSVRNLGVQIDENLRMDEQVAMCRRSCYYHMRRIRQVRHLLDSSSLRALVVAFVLGRIDYCNSLYASCTQTVLQGLQRVQSTAARLLTGSGRLESAVPLMRELHWLPVSSRIRYKLCTLMYDVVHGTAPGYLVDLCRPCGDMRLRSGPRGDYFVPFSRLSMTQKSFRFSGPRAWNSLPGNVRDAPSRTAFANRLKKHLFKLAYS